MARAPRRPRKKGDNIVFPVTPFVVESINKNFDTLFKDTGNLAEDRLLSGLGIDTIAGAPVRGDLIVAQLLPTEFEPKWARFAIGDVNTVLRTSGIDPEWNKVHLTTDVDEILPVANGGTNVGTYTAGSVVFAGAGGLLLTEDNANFFWDDTNNRLGIGTNAPSAPLEIQVPNIAATSGVLASRILNPTAATAGVPRQFSPTLSFLGQAWDTDAAGSSVTQRLALYMRTGTGGTTSGFLAIADDSDGAGVLTDIVYIGRAFPGGTPDLRFLSGNIAFANVGRGIYFTANPLTDDLSTVSAVFSGDVSGGNNRIKTSIITGYFFIEGNNFASSLGTVPMMDFRGFDQSFASPIMQIRMRCTPGGTVAAGFGSSIRSQANSSTTADQDQGAIDIVWSDHTHATRSADVVFRLVDAAAAIAEKFRFASTGLATIPSLNLTSGALGNADGTTYTPTRSAETNLDANVTVTQAQYVRLRNAVTVSGRFTADPTAPATPTSFELTLPIASNIGAVEDVAGVAFCGSIAGQGAEITGSVANNTAVVTWVSGDVTSQSWSYTFTYQVI